MNTTTLTERRAALVADDALGGSAFGAAYAALVEEWLQSLVGDEAGIAVIGGGALGRRELAPGSLSLIHI